MLKKPKVAEKGIVNPKRGGPILEYISRTSSMTVPPERNSMNTLAATSPRPEPMTMRGRAPSHTVPPLARKAAWAVTPSEPSTPTWESVTVTYSPSPNWMAPRKRCP